MLDPYDQESQQRCLDRDRSRFERTHEYCERCRRWVSRFVEHECKGESKGDNVI